jgi:ribulose-5-phosphate 4-epimerase/fuculose-1-phosphate aldolase
MTTTTTSPQARYGDLVARSIRIINAAGVMQKSGHVAIRDADDPNVMWINSRKASRSTLTAADVVAVDLRTGEQIGRGDEPPSELHIHREILRARPDVGAVAHSHPKYVVALSVAGHTLVPVTVDGQFLPLKTPMLDDARLINSEERGALVARTLGDASAVVLRGHGLIVVGRNVEEATTRLILAESNAWTQYTASALGEPRVLRPDELVDLNHSYDEKAVRKSWHYEEETARRAGALDGLEHP